jgi:ribonucleoside-diphosphate reductase alpha chain
MTYSKYYWLNEESRKFLSRGYITESPEQRIKDIARTAEKYLGISGFAQKFEDYMSRGFYSLSTPVWINFGKQKGLPISCYGSNVDDNLDSILNAGREIGMMSKYGGGTSVYLGNIRERGAVISTGGTADGPVHYARIYDTVVDVCKQSEARRGACAAYLPVEHPDILEFLNIGTEGNLIQNLQYGITVTDVWLKDMKEGDFEKRKICKDVMNLDFLILCLKITLIITLLIKNLVLK